MSTDKVGFAKVTCPSKILLVKISWVLALLAGLRIRFWVQNYCIAPACHAITENCP